MKKQKNVSGPKSLKGVPSKDAKTRARHEIGSKGLKNAKSK